MKKIKTFGISALRNEESFGFLKVVVTETDNLPAEETTPAALTNAVPHQRRRRPERGL